ncbi:MEKHLA domain-containing protein, partial [Streptomyces sp. NPDC055210]
FGDSWHEFCGLPARLSAPAADRAERDRALAGVTGDGYVEGYRGLRISGTGRRFWIENVTIWNLADREGSVRGQAAIVRSWSEAA